MTKLVNFVDDIDLALQEIAVLKEVDRKTRSLEVMLRKRMGEVLQQAGKNLITSFLSMRGIPNNDLMLTALFSSIYDMEGAFSLAFEEVATLAAVAGANRTIYSAMRQGLKVDLSYNGKPDKVFHMMNDARFQASRRTVQRIVGNVQQSLANSYKNGLGITDAARELEKEFKNMEKHELERVARTEINSFQNLGVYEQSKKMNIQYFQWIAASDGRTRDSHRDMDGQIVRLGDTFSNGLKRPGDKGGKIEEWINCRCRLVPYIMPLGMMAPPGKKFFYEKDIVPIGQDPEAIRNK